MKVKTKIIKAYKNKLCIRFTKDNCTEKMKKANDWFINWFNSKYYHILYSDRNEVEANEFIEFIVSKLSLKLDNKVLDLGCGNGRHSVSLSKYFHEVDGLDISSENIRIANKNKKTNLSFYLSDMRDFKTKNIYGYIFNLFTSFGYFDNKNDNIKVLKSCYNHLKKNGLILIDFLNADKIKTSNSELKEIKIIDQIKFEITKKIVGDFITKEIIVFDGELKFNFSEKVQLFGLEGFKSLFKATGFKIIETFGDYYMNPYNLNSNRLILLAKKINR